MGLNILADIADIVAVPIAIIGVLIVVQQMYLSRKEAQTEHLKRQKETTLQAYNIVRDNLRKRLVEIRKELELYDMYTVLTEQHLNKILENEKLRVELSIALGIHERFAIGILHEVYNLELIYDLSGTHFVQVFKQFKPYIYKTREQQPSFIEGLECLVGKLQKINDSRKNKNLKGNIQPKF